MTNIKKNRKITVALLFGGDSFEHEVSVVSGRAIDKGLDREKYDVILIYIDYQGRWIRLEESDQLVGVQTSVEDALLGVDVAFPAFHGPLGEDGAFQGLCKLFNTPFVGSDVLSSSICYDKVACKQMLGFHKIPIVPYAWFYSTTPIPYESLTCNLGTTLFIKPANSGSSVGISKVRTVGEYEKAIELASKYDSKIVVERAIEGREIELAILGNQELVISKPGEIVSKRDFYDYEAKYIDPDGAKLIVPAQIDISLSEIAERGYRACFCEGLARIDFLVSHSGEVFLNEINTIPGFTPISLFPKLMMLEGFLYSELLDRLIELALEPHVVRKPVQSITK